MELEISMEELEAEIDIILHTLRVKIKRIQLVRNAGAQFICEDFEIVQPPNLIRRESYE